VADEAAIAILAARPVVAVALVNAATERWSEDAVVLLVERSVDPISGPRRPSAPGPPRAGFRGDGPPVSVTYAPGGTRGAGGRWGNRRASFSSLVRGLWIVPPSYPRRSSLPSVRLLTTVPAIGAAALSAALAPPATLLLGWRHNGWWAPDLTAFAAIVGAAVAVASARRVLALRTSSTEEAGGNTTPTGPPPRVPLATGPSSGP
jgi:hypothetical protein